MHSAVDGYSRLADDETLDDETAPTALGLQVPARAFFAGPGITIERVLTDNGSPYVSPAWRDESARLGNTQSRTRVRRPQTNGKVERLKRTLLDEWAYKRLYTSEKARRVPCQAACTTTTTTGRTPPWASSRRSPAAPTSPSSTASLDLS